VPPRRALDVVIAAAALGVLVQYLFVRERAGVNVLVATAAFVAIGWSLQRDGRRMLRWQAASASLAILFAGLCAIRSEAAVVFFDAAAALAFAGAYALAASGASLAAPLLVLVREALSAAEAALARFPAVWIAAVPAARASLVRASPVTGYATGGLVAVPFLVVFIALFASADAVFERAVRDLLDLEWLRDLLRDLPFRVVTLLLVMWAATGAFVFMGAERHAADEPRVAAVLPRDTALAALVLIDALFVAFVVLQIAYLFGGRDTLATAGVTYSAYGRRGFFELVAVSAIVGALLFGGDLLLRARGRAYVAAALALLALTGAVLVSATYRMALYQQAYGWSELRLYTFAAIALIGCGLAILGWAIVTRRMDRVIVPLVVAAAVAAIAVNVIGPADQVARRNIERVLDPSALPDDASRGLDVAYLASLGDGAVPALYELAPRLPSAERSAVIEALRVASLRPRATEGWQSWNVDRQRARALGVTAIGPGLFSR